MQHFNTVIEDAGQLSTFLCSEKFRTAASASNSALVQIYAGGLENERLNDFIPMVRSALPHAVIVGATSAGEISQGRVSLDSLVMSVAFFSSSRLASIAVDCSSNNEYATGTAVAETFQAIPNLQGILLLAPAARINCAKILEGIQCVLPKVQVFGGGAVESEHDRRAFVLHDLHRYETGCVAVALSGPELHIDTHVSFGWKAIGPMMTFTDVNGFQVREIDGKPAVDTYRKYLGIGADEDDIYLLEFPLLIERATTLIARNPVATDESGCVTMVADVCQGETARLGYLDVDAVVRDMDRVRQSIDAFSPDAVFLYSCICRRFTLQEEVEHETRPLQAAAPVAGFFTSGEFCKLDGHLQLLNSSQVTVALREGEARHTVSQVAVANAEKDRYRFRHARITSRLFQFITALTEEVAQANFLLRHQADHDGLTGALNRRALDQRLDAELSRADRYSRPLSIVMIDLDHFKRFNDEFGHAAGDHVLRNMASTIGEMMRGSDALYRYGGEEFMILLPEATKAGAGIVAEKARAAVEAMRLEYDCKQLPTVTISLGVACYPQHGKNSEELLKAADEMLYESKVNGRNRVSVAGCVVAAVRPDRKGIARTGGDQ